MKNIENNLVNLMAIEDTNIFYSDLYLVMKDMFFFMSIHYEILLLTNFPNHLNSGNVRIGWGSGVLG